MKWDLDLWYELWDRAGSQGLDTWYDLGGEAHDGPTPDARRMPDLTSSKRGERGLDQSLVQSSRKGPGTR
jgi:hypothetical protein